MANVIIVLILVVVVGIALKSTETHEGEFLLWQWWRNLSSFRR